jgi:hypothetical protein
MELKYEYVYTIDTVVEVPYCRKLATPPPPPTPVVPPAIDVRELPSRLNIGAETLNAMEGYYAIIDIDRVDFVTPESDQVSPDGTYIVDVHGNSRPRTCTDIAQKDAHGQVWRDALLNLTDWHAPHSTQLLINANWFDVAPPFESPNVNLCTNMFGYAVSDDRELVAANVTDHGNLLDALVLFTTKKSSTAFIRAAIVSNAEIAQYNRPKFAVAGFIILRGGASVQNIPSSDSPLVTFSRTAVGLSSDGKKMIIVVEQRGKFLDIKAGLTAAQMAGLLKYLGADTAINLDNSGSSQLVYYANVTDSSPKYISKPGDMVECSQHLRVPCTAAEQQLDHEGEIVVRYRPVPNFLGIKPK